MTWRKEKRFLDLPWLCRQVKTHRAFQFFVFLNEFLSRYSVILFLTVDHIFCFTWLAYEWIVPKINLSVVINLLGIPKIPQLLYTKFNNPLIKNVWNSAHVLLEIEGKQEQFLFTFSMLNVQLQSQWQQYPIIFGILYPCQSREPSIGTGTVWD